MELQAGYRFRTAPRFHRSVQWSDRICLNNGVDSADPRLLPLSGWRPATNAELSLLVDDSEAGEPLSDSLLGHIHTFALPGHLHSRWWTVANQLTELPVGDSVDYWNFVRDIASFLGFKGLPLPPRCAFDVVLSSSGKNVQPRLSEDLRDTSAISSLILATINLGDGPASLVFLNLPQARMAELLNSREKKGKSNENLSGSALAFQFLTAFPNYPLIRLSLEPGEGVWLPPSGGTFQRYPSGQQVLDVWLVVRSQPDKSANE